MSKTQLDAAEHNVPTRAQVRRWRKYLADEYAEARIYRNLAAGKTGEERDILLQVASAEGRHVAHWEELLGEHIGRAKRATIQTRLLGALAKRFGTVFVLALAQRAERRSPYAKDADATRAMAADEAIHSDVVSGLATSGRRRLSGGFRAAVFGANDGLVSNLSLVVGVSAGGVSNHVVLLTGLAGLLGGALSMAAGEFVSVRSQRELLESSTPVNTSEAVVRSLDVNANELALVFRSRGMSTDEANRHAGQVLDEAQRDVLPVVHPQHLEGIGTGFGAARSSFAAFSVGAVIPVLPYIFGLQGAAAALTAVGVVGVGLLTTGAMVGLLSGSSPLLRGLRQLAIGYGAAMITYLLGSLFGTG